MNRSKIIGSFHQIYRQSSSFSLPLPVSSALFTCYNFFFRNSRLSVFIYLYTNLPKVFNLISLIILQSQFNLHTSCTISDTIATLILQRTYHSTAFCFRTLTAPVLSRPQRPAAPRCRTTRSASCRRCRPPRPSPRQSPASPWSGPGTPACPRPRNQPYTPPPGDARPSPLKTINGRIITAFNSSHGIIIIISGFFKYQSSALLDNLFHCMYLRYTWMSLSMAQNLRQNEI